MLTSRTAEYYLEMSSWLNFSSLSTLRMLELRLRDQTSFNLQISLELLHRILSEAHSSCSISLWLPLHVLLTSKSEYISAPGDTPHKHKKRDGFNELARLEQRTTDVTFIVDAHVAHHLVEKIRRMLHHKFPTLTAKKLLHIQLRYGRTNTSSLKMMRSLTKTC